MNSSTLIGALLFVCAVLIGIIMALVIARKTSSSSLADQAGALKGLETHTTALDELAKNSAATQALLGQIEQRLNESKTSQVRDTAATMQSLDDTSRAVAGLSQALVQVQKDLAAVGQNTSVQGRYTSTSLEQIRTNIEQMNAVMVNKKARGSWGEYQLESLLALYGGNSKRVWEAQYTLSTGVRADAVLHLPSSNRVLCVDSKFPLEAYQRIVAAQTASDAAAVLRARAQLASHVKTHIASIANKYVVRDETADVAVMFIPSEAVYYEICSSMPELVEGAVASHVLIASPTTLVGVVLTLVGALADVERVRNIDKIVHRITLLEDNARRLQERIAQCDKSFTAASDKLHQVRISADKIAGDIERLGTSASIFDDESTN